MINRPSKTDFAQKIKKSSSREKSAEGLASIFMDRRQTHLRRVLTSDCQATPLHRPSRKSNFYIIFIKYEKWRCRRAAGGVSRRQTFF